MQLRWISKPTPENYEELKFQPEANELDIEVHSQLQQQEVP